jgi:hypothetical protein
MKSNTSLSPFHSFLVLVGLLALLFGCDVKNPPMSSSKGTAHEDKAVQEKAEGKVVQGKAEDKAVQEQQNQIDRVSSINNLKLIGLAMHNFASANRALPPAYLAGKDGKPLLSWRVRILPYLDQENLFRQFHLDEPWDSEHNKPLLANMPNVYKAPGSKVADQYKANYLTVRGKDTIFSGKSPCTFGAIKDGTSNTVMTVEVSDARAVEWTRPDDFEFNPQDPSDGLGGLRDNGFLIGVADGSVRFVRLPKSPEILNAWFNKSDRKPVQIND